MASYAKCFSIFFLFLALSYTLQIQARESKFFSKYGTRVTEAISITQSPTQSPAPAPELSSSDVEHGYGLYGREPVKTAANVAGEVKYVSVAGEVKYVEAEGLGKKTFRDFIMPNSNDYRNGWNRNGNENGNESEKQGMSDTRFLENGKYYYDANNEENGIGNEKHEMSEYMEENPLPENQGNGYESQQGTGEKKYLVNGKYYSGYVTKSENGNEKQNMGEYVEDENSFPENTGNGNGYETEKEETGEKRYFVNGKYYSGYVTGSKNRNENQKQGMSEYVKDEYNFPENKRNGNDQLESVKEEMGEKKYLVNGKYYSGYITKSENENEKQGMMSEYVEDENIFPENKGNNEYGNEKKYFVNGKYYEGYVTKSEHGDHENQNYDTYEDLSAFNRKNHYAIGHNENEFYDGNNEYVRERQNEYAP